MPGIKRIFMNPNITTFGTLYIKKITMDLQEDAV